MMDTKALREKVLDLAIRGKLVPQDPNDDVVERFSVFAATGFNAALGIHLFLERPMKMR